jgi:hypothetical protein
MNSDIDAMLDIMETLRDDPIPPTIVELVATREDITAEQLLRIIGMGYGLVNDEAIWLSPWDLLEVDPEFQIEPMLLSRFKYATIDDLINFPQSYPKIDKEQEMNAVDLINSGKISMIDRNTEGMTLDIAIRYGVRYPILTRIQDLIEYREPYYYSPEQLNYISARSNTRSVPQIYKRLISLGHWSVVRNSTKPMKIIAGIYDLDIICS